MNKELEDRIYNIPDNIIEFLSQQKSGQDGTIRNNNLINSKQVTYGQLKRILHDMKYMDKTRDIVKYNLYGGELMEKWGTTILNNDRGFVKSRKESRKNANDTGIIGRQNGYLSSHTKKDNYTVPTNIMKSNSEKTSVSSLGLTEEIKRIKKLMK
jgi:hypothetical protein